MRNFLKEWLGFSKKERLGMIILLLMISFFLVLPAVYSPKLEPPKIDSGLVKYLNEHPINRVATATSLESDKAETVVATALFYFNPNTLDQQGWEKLGVNPKVIRTIFNYRNKGGKFTKPADLKKIWGFLPADADRLIPFVNIPTSTSFTRPSFERAYVAPKQTQLIDINQATVSDWESLPGIGPVLANRIIKFRDKLGRFDDIQQVAKTYGISDSVFNKILPLLTIRINKQPSHLNEQMNVSQAINWKDSILNVNTATADQLIQVGINDGVAKAIVLYRKQYGKFKQITDLKQIIFINEQVYQQIIPKLRLE